MSENKIKVGVYVCHCGGNISDVIDVKAVAEELKHYHDVEISQEYVFMCSDAGQKLIIEDIKNGKINRVVVAACSPALHELTFRKALQRANLNPYLYEHVNIREQASWVHKKAPVEATAKAVRLVRAGVEKVVRQEGLESIIVEATKHAVVLGGGVGGMRSALSLADRGLQVSLVEKSGQLGGRLNELHTTYPNNENAIELVAELKAEVLSRKSISLYLNSDTTSISGFVGNFFVELTGGEKIKAGAIVIATGNVSYQPFDGEFGYKNQPNVVTLLELQQMIKGASTEQGSHKYLMHCGNPVRSVAFIHCVGSRQQEGVNQPQADGKVNEYCSRVCCSSALQAINEMHARFPKTQIYDIYRDIRTYARFTEERLYEQASKNGTTFFRYTEEQLPKVEGRTVVVKDVLTWNQEVEFEADLVVLVTGLMPNPIPNVISALKLPVGGDRFLSEAHPKLRPVEVANNGIYLAGTCQAPMDITEVSAGAAAASSKAAILLGGDSIALDPYVAFVREDKCDGCGLCVPECSYTGAILIDSNAKAKVNSALCKGCGACVAVCPHRALDLNGWQLEQIEAMVSTFAEA